MQAVEGQTNPKPSGATTVGRMDTRPRTPVLPVRQPTGFQVTMRLQLSPTRKEERSTTRIGICRGIKTPDGVGWL
jgi:hypothetical protein